VRNSILTLVAALALSATAVAQTGSSDTAGSNGTTSTQRGDDTQHHDYGWIGLLGLVGLAGLRKQDHTRTLNSTNANTR